MTNTEWMTRREVTDTLRIARSTLYRWIRAGVITQHRITGTNTVRYRREEIERLIRSAQ